MQTLLRHGIFDQAMLIGLVIACRRKRNWQHPSFDAKAGRWDVVIYEDSGRFLRPVFPGYRALVTRPDGSQAWANLPWPGQETYPYDYMSGGGPGGVWRFKRDAVSGGPPSVLFRARGRRAQGDRAGTCTQGKPRTVADWGYNQAFREIFAAYEPRLTAKGRKQWSEMVVLNHKERGMWDCPGEKLLGVTTGAATVAVVAVEAAPTMPPRPRPRCPSVAPRPRYRWRASGTSSLPWPSWASA